MFRKFGWMLTAALAITIAVPVFAREKHEDHDKDRDHHVARQWRDHDDHFRRSRYNDHDRDDRKGWSKGHKAGWRGENMPPGQAKKHNDHDRDDWVRDRNYRHNHRTYSTRYRRPNSAPVVVAGQPRTNPTQQGHGPIPVPRTNNAYDPAQQKPSARGPIVVPGR